MADETTIYPPHKEDVIFNKPSLKEFIRLIKQGSIHEIWPSSQEEINAWRAGGFDAFKKLPGYSHNDRAKEVKKVDNAITIFYGDNQDKKSDNIIDGGRTEQVFRNVQTSLNNILDTMVGDPEYFVDNRSEFGYDAYPLSLSKPDYELINADNWKAQKTNIIKSYTDLVDKINELYKLLLTFDINNSKYTSWDETEIIDDSYTQDFINFFNATTNEIKNIIKSEGEDYGVQTNLAQLKKDYKIMDLAVNNYYDFNQVKVMLDDFNKLCDNLLNIKDYNTLSDSLITGLEGAKISIAPIIIALTIFDEKKKQLEKEIQNFFSFAKGYYIDFSQKLIQDPSGEEGALIPFIQSLKITSPQIGTREDIENFYNEQLKQYEERYDSVQSLLSIFKEELSIKTLDGIIDELTEALDGEARQTIINNWIDEFNSWLTEFNFDLSNDLIKDQIEQAQGWIVNGFLFNIDNQNSMRLTINNLPPIRDNGINFIGYTILTPILTLLKEQFLVDENGKITITPIVSKEAETILTLNAYIEKLVDASNELQSFVLQNEIEYNYFKDIIMDDFVSSLLINGVVEYTVLTPYRNAFSAFRNSENNDSTSFKTVDYIDDEDTLKELNGKELLHKVEMLEQIKAQYDKFNLYLDILQGVGLVLDKTESNLILQKNTLINKINTVPIRAIGKLNINAINTDLINHFNETEIRKCATRITKNIVNSNAGDFGITEGVVFADVFIPKIDTATLSIGNRQTVLNNLDKVLTYNRTLSREYVLNSYLSQIAVTLDSYYKIYQTSDTEHYACISIGSDVENGTAENNGNRDGTAVIVIDGKKYYAALNDLARAYPPSRGSQVLTGQVLTDFINKELNEKWVRGSYGAITNPSNSAGTNLQGWTVKDKSGNNASLKADKLIGAVYNDYAEYRSANAEPGRCIIENGDGTLRLADTRLQLGGAIVSDTFGFSIGATTEATCPIAVSGRVLAYPLEDVSLFKPGAAVCSGPDGTISLMTRAEIKEWPDAIVGYVSEIPTYDTWGTDNVPVNGRIWIKIK